MDDNNQNIAVYKQNPLVAIFAIIIIPTLLYFFLNVFLSNDLLSIIISVVVGIVVVLFIILANKSIYISNSDITVKSLFGTKKTLWSDVISMSVVAQRSPPSYQIKASNQVIKIPQMTHYTDFENKVVSLAHLQVADSSPLNTFNLGFTPKLRRWTKVDNQYTPSSTVDSLNDIFYISFWKNHEGLVLFVVVAMVIFFIVFIYSLFTK